MHALGEQKRLPSLRNRCATSEKTTVVRMGTVSCHFVDVFCQKETGGMGHPTSSVVWKREVQIRDAQDMATCEEGRKEGRDVVSGAWCVW